MMKINQKELTQKLTTERLEITAVEIIRSHKNPELCSVIINDKLFSTPYIMDYSFELIQTIKNPSHIINNKQYLNGFVEKIKY